MGGGPEQCAEGLPCRLAWALDSDGSARISEVLALGLAARAGAARESYEYGKRGGRMDQRYVLLDRA